MGMPAPTLAPEAPKKYRKTALVEAKQFLKAGDHPAVVETTESPTGFGINTLENTKLKYEVTLGDWIVGPGPKGEFYACKPEIFSATYEEVTE